MTDISELKEIKLQDLKQKTPAELVSLAEELQVENASALRKQELMFRRRGGTQIQLATDLFLNWIMKCTCFIREMK